jgi:hypothetical protein
MPPERRATFGAAAQLHDARRDVWGWRWLDHLRHDLIYGARGFRRDRRFALPAVGAIVLAVGQRRRYSAWWIAACSGRCRTRRGTGWCR